MPEQNPDAKLLTPEQIELIKSTAKTPNYINSPVPETISEQFAPVIDNFVHITYTAKSKLAALYGTTSNYMNLFQADWQAALSCGAIKLYKETMFSFPTHIALANGEALEVSIAPNEQPFSMKRFFSSICPRR